ncbi:uncharacterized protein [Nicotiana sylvestris]|uniref:uncharacterized protein n=1 Tax=Nicotiana sylvestris TaxID=4096 RepID=UPI00388C8CBC
MGRSLVSKDEKEQKDVNGVLGFFCVLLCVLGVSWWFQAMAAGGSVMKKSVLPGSWKSKVNAITEAKDLQTLTMDELIGNLKTYEMKRKKYSERREPKKEKNLVLKAESNDSSDEESDMAYLTKRFQKMVRRNGGIPKWGSSSKTRNNDLCHRCGKSGHFIKNCPLAKQKQYKQNPNKAGKRNLVPDKRFNRKSVADNIVKQALAALGDSSSESERESDSENSSMMAV